MSACGAFISSMICDQYVVVDGVVVVVLVLVVVLVVVGIVVILSVVDVVLVVDGVANVDVRRVDRVVAVLDVRFGSMDMVVDGVVVDGVAQVVVDVELGVEVITSAIDCAVVRITRPRAVTAVPVVVRMVVDLEVAVRGASRNCAMSRGSVPNMAPAFRIECCLMLSANIDRDVHTSVSCADQRPPARTRSNLLAYARCSSGLAITVKR